MEVRSPDTAQQSVVGFNNVLYRNVIADANVTYVQKQIHPMLLLVML